MARRRYSTRRFTQRRKGLRYGKAFRTRAGRYGRYVYRYGRRVAFELVRSKFKKYIREDFDRVYHRN